MSDKRLTAIDIGREIQNVSDRENGIGFIWFEIFLVALFVWSKTSLEWGLGFYLTGFFLVFIPIILKIVSWFFTILWTLFWFLAFLETNILLSIVAAFLAFILSYGIHAYAREGFDRM